MAKEKVQTAAEETTVEITAEKNIDKELKQKAKELMQQLGVEVIYYSADGYWFTKADLAEAHAKNAKVEVTEFKK